MSDDGDELEDSEEFDAELDLDDEEGLNLGGLFEQAQAMQQRLFEAQAKAAETIIEGQSGGGVVKVTCTGALDFRSMTIKPEAVDPADVPMLEDLILAAVRDAVAKANSLTTELLGPFGGLVS